MSSLVVLPLSIRTVFVEAPANLQEGYTFETVINGKVMTVKVPPGGVGVGEIFQGIVVSTENESLVGRWRYDLNSFCRFGAFHPVFLWSFSGCLLCWIGTCYLGIMTCCMPEQVFLAQIMTRLKLNICAQPGKSEAVWQRTYLIMWIIFIVNFVLAPEIGHLQIYDGSDAWIPWQIKLKLVNWLFVIFLLIKTRMFIRHRDQIFDETCVTDVLCSIFCTPCTLSQMASHTVDYDETQAKCCSKTGLSPSDNSGHSMITAHSPFDQSLNTSFGSINA